MPGKSKAVSSGNELRDTVVEIGRGLGLVPEIEVAVGRSIWGARRRFAVVVKQPETRVS